MRRNYDRMHRVFYHIYHLHILDLLSSGLLARTTSGNVALLCLISQDQYTFKEVSVFKKCKDCQR